MRYAGRFQRALNFENEEVALIQNSFKLAANARVWCSPSVETASMGTDSLVIRCAVFHPCSRHFQSDEPDCLHANYDILKHHQLLST